MAVGDIEHKELPDNLLHEPKGARTAQKDTLYVADGKGSGEFRKITLDSINIPTPEMSPVTLENIVDTEIITGTSLVGTIDGNLLPVPAFSNVPGELINIVNKNTKELYALYVNLKTINAAVKDNISILQSKQTEIINKLKEIGIIKDESTN